MKAGQRSIRCGVGFGVDLGRQDFALYFACVMMIHSMVSESPRVTTRSISSTNDGCEDTQDKEQCLSWAFFGECEKNPGYMLTNCRKSCKQCGKDKGARVITQST
eukprot:1160406-Pelagomonas_calceolata.AAC.10